MRATDDPQTLADTLIELARSVALFGSGSDGEIVLQDIGEGHDQGFALALAAAGASHQALRTDTIPTLGYGWLLRHVSRVFVHNLNLVSDAEYREVLARTFLGLAEQKSAGVTEAERVLVLNALFRPAPPHAPEDGPPTGLLDLLGKRP